MKYFEEKKKKRINIGPSAVSVFQKLYVQLLKMRVYYPGCLCKRHRNDKMFTYILQVLNAIPDQDSFYDVTDALEELGMEQITRIYMNRHGADLDLLAQFQIYEVITVYLKQVKSF